MPLRCATAPVFVCAVPCGGGVADGWVIGSIPVGTSAVASHDPDLCQYVCAGFGVQALTTGQGALGSLANFSNTFGVDLEEIEKAAENVVS